MKKTIQEFREFIAQGNIIDMATGVIIGGALDKTMASLVDDITMSLVSLLIGGTDFSNLYVALDEESYPNIEATREATAILTYGGSIQNVINFLIIASVILITSKRILAAPKRSKKERVAKPTAEACSYCLSEIPLKANRCPRRTSQLTTGRVHGG